MPLFSHQSAHSLEHARVIVEQQVLVDLHDPTELQLTAFDVAVVDAVLEIMQFGMLQTLQLQLAHLAAHVEEFAYVVHVCGADLIVANADYGRTGCRLYWNKPLRVIGQKRLHFSPKKKNHNLLTDIMGF